MEEYISIDSRHRKEKKELQAHIQALKKTAKNDKTKKKELSLEITRLEAELETKHKQELEASQNENGVSDEVHDSEATSETTKVPKISKAQKRRHKKSELERKRAEEIKLQEKENLHGPRNLESEAICGKLKEDKKRIFNVPSDGDCLYKAISHQLSVARQTDLSVEELRKKVAEYIRQNKDEFIPFMSNPDTCEMLTDLEFEDYCDKIVNTKVWGGQLEIRALSNSLKCPITVIQATAPGLIQQGAEYEGPPLVITYHRHMYSLGEHYNSTQPLGDDNDENID